MAVAAIFIARAELVSREPSFGPESAQRHNEKQTFESIDTHVLTAHDVNFS